MSSAEELTRIEEKVRSLCEPFLETGRPYLLSRLGADLGPDLRTLKILSGRSLAEFVQGRFADRYSIVLGGQHQNVQALVRANAKQPEMTQPSLTVHAMLSEEAKGQRYHYKFWAAFSVPLKTPKRYLNLLDFNFEDTQPTTGDYAEINSSYIAPEQIENRDEWIKKRIEAWLAEHKFAPERFYAKSASPSLRARPGEMSVLEAMINALDRRQLASLSLPLDVVAELLRKRM